MKKLILWTISICFLLPSISFAKGNGIGQCVSECVHTGMLNTDNATACVDFCKYQRGEDFWPEAAALIDQLGGKFGVKNVNSPYYGIEMTVPEGAVQEPTFFMIAEPTIPLPPLPDEVEQEGEPIFFEASSEFYGPVVVEIPFVGSTEDDNELRLLFYFNEDNGEWEVVPPTQSASPEKIRVMLDHFSTYVKGKVKIRSSSIITGFDMKKNLDTFSFDNKQYDENIYGPCMFETGNKAPGICSGMSFISETFFNNFSKEYDEGLGCYWSNQVAYDVACEAHTTFHTEYNGFLYMYTNLITLGSNLPGIDNFLIEYIKYKLRKNKVVPVSLGNIALILKWPFIESYYHAIVVFGWKKTGIFSGKFYVYDNQKRSQTREITYSGLRARLDYTDAGGDDYNSFGIMPSGKKSLSNYLETLIEKTPGEYVCDESDVLLEENFESYGINSWPSPWYPDGNANSSRATNKIVQDPQNSSNRVLKTYGRVGGCWGALAYYPIAFPEDFYVELKVYNGSESLSGCHQARGGFGMKSGTHWSNPGYNFMLFHEGTTVGHGWSDVLANYGKNRWYDVKIHYERSGNQVTLTYWLDGNHLGQTTDSVDLAKHLTLDHFQLVVQEGSAYFDNIKIYTD